MSIAAPTRWCASGFKRGERVLMVVKDCPAFFYLFWGAIKAGIVPVPLNTLLRSSSYAFMIDDSGAAALVYSPEFASEVEPALADATQQPRYVLRTEGEADSLADAARAEPAATSTPCRRRADDDCFWLYSSGSTGSPKGAVHRHRDMVVSSQRYGVETLGIREDDIFYSEAKLFFAYGLGNNMTFPLWVGATAVLNDQRPGPASSFPLIERYRPTLYFGVPTLYAAYLQHFAQGEAGPVLDPASASPPARRCRPKSCGAGTRKPACGFWTASARPRRCTSSFPTRRTTSSPAPAARWCPAIARASSMSTEATSPTATAASCLSPATRLRAATGTIPSAPRRTMVDGWLNTGDTYRRDAEGYFYYCGRSDDMLKVGGIWCSPFEIESKLVEHPDVLEAAVVGRVDQENLIKPEAFVVLKDGQVGSDALAAELTEFCKNGLAPYKYPRWINFVTELPKTATGKIQRFLLRK